MKYELTEEGDFWIDETNGEGTGYFRQAAKQNLEMEI